MTPVATMNATRHVRQRHERELDRAVDGQQQDEHERAGREQELAVGALHRRVEVAAERGRAGDVDVERAAARRDLAQRVDRRRDAVRRLRGQRHDRERDVAVCRHLAGRRSEAERHQRPHRERHPRRRAARRRRCAPGRPASARLRGGRRAAPAAGRRRESARAGSGSPGRTATTPGSRNSWLVSSGSFSPSGPRTTASNAQARDHDPPGTAPGDQGRQPPQHGRPTRGRASSSARRRARSTSRTSAAPSSSSPCARCRRSKARARS